MRQPEAEDEGSNQQVSGELPAHACFIARNKARPTASLVTKCQGKQNCGNDDGNSVGGVAHVRGELTDGEKLHRENSIALDGDSTEEQRGGEHEGSPAFGCGTVREMCDSRSHMAVTSAQKRARSEVALASPLSTPKLREEQDQDRNKLKGGVASKKWRAVWCLSGQPFELNWTDIVQCRVTPDRVVEAVDVPADGLLGLSPGLEHGAPDQFGL